MTSYDVIRHFKRHLPKPFGKIGHLGTLDPFAQGVLLIALGGGQKLNDFVHGQFSKSYRCVGVLGVQTATGDLTVSPSFEDHSENFMELKTRPSSFFEDQWLTFRGDYLQVPPMYSATKFKGRPLHSWARKGVAVLKNPVRRTIEEISLEKISFPFVHFFVRASSGTYIRTLFEDMAKKVKTFGALKSLERVGIGPFSSEDSLPVEKWPNDGGASWQWKNEDKVESKIVLPKAWLGSEGTKKYSCGQRIDSSMVVDWTSPHDSSVPKGMDNYFSSPFWVMEKENQKVLGMATRDKDGLLTTQVNLF